MGGKLIVSTAALEYDRKTKTFYIDASTLEAMYPAWRHSRLDYEDGKWCLRLRSHKTGIVVKFVREKEIRDSEGELMAVNFCGTDSYSDVSFQIFND
jgi:hypothetical protein